MSFQIARNDPYQIVTDLILGHLERGVIPWRCPWKREVGRPKNFSSKREYRGINSLLLGITGYASPWWMTFRQAQEAGGSIRKGEKSSLIMKYGKNEKATKDGGGEEDKRVTYYLRSYHVFNSSQIDGIEFPAVETFSEEIPPQEKLRRAESIVAEMPKPPVIKAGKGVRACYRPKTDTVNMPAIGRFDQPEDYYKTLFHELIHATGHSTRLDRKTLTESDGFGGEIYSQEELVAEMGAAFLGLEAEIIHDQHEQSASYMKGWLDALKEPDNRRWIIYSATKAGYAVNYVLNQANHPLEDEHIRPNDSQQVEIANAYSLGT